MKNISLGILLLISILLCTRAYNASLRDNLEEKQTTMAFQAKMNGDWLTLIQLARMAHSQKQESIWEKSLIEWAQELVLYKHNSIGAFHLSGYYHDVGNWSQEGYWHNLGEEWRKKKSHRL